MCVSLVISVLHGDTLTHAHTLTHVARHACMQAVTDDLPLAPRLTSWWMLLLALQVSCRDLRFWSCCMAPGMTPFAPSRTLRALLMQHDSGTVCALNLPSLNQISYGFRPWFLMTDCESVNGRTPQQASCSMSMHECMQRAM